MKAGCRTPSKGRGPQQGGGLRHLKMPPVKKTSNATKFKAKTTKKESVVNPSTLRRTSEGRTPTKRSSSSSCSESSPKSSSGVSSRSRSSNSSSLSPSRAPSRVTGRSPARRSCGRSPNRGADSAKVNGKGARAAQKGDAGTSKLSKIAENAGGSLKTKAVSEKKQDLVKAKKTASPDSNKSASQSAKVSPAEKGKKSSPKCRRNSESKTEGNAKSSDEKEESDKDGKKKTSKKTKDASASEKQESDKDLKKKTKKGEDKKGDTEKVTKNKSRKSDEKNDTECESKRKSKKSADKVCDSPGKVKESKIKEEKDTEGQTKEECEKDRKQKEDSDKDGKKRDDLKVSNVKDENELSIKQESDESNKKNDDNDKQPEKKKGRKLTVDKDDEEKEDNKGRKMKEDKSEGRKTSDVGDFSVVKSEKEPASLYKDGKLSSPGKRDKVGKGEAKDMSEDGSSNTSKPKKKSAVKKILASEGENGFVKEEKEKKPTASKKDNPAHSEGKERSKSLSSSQETLVPKKRGRPKGSKNKRKNDGLPPARIKKDKQKTEKKQCIGKVTKNKKERSEFSFSESDGEREEKVVKVKKGSKTKQKICEEKEVLDDEENSSSDSSSSDEESTNSFKGISKAKLYGGHTDYPKKVVIGGKVYKLKRETPKSRLNSKKAPNKFHQNRKIKKHSAHVFDSEEESERDIEVNKIVKMRSDYSESSDSEIIKKPKKPSDCLNEETSYDDMSDDDEDWGTRKPRKRQTKNARTRKGMMPLKNNLTERMSEKSDDDKDDDTDEEVEEEEDGDDYGTLKSNRRGPMNSKETALRNKRSSTNPKRTKEVLPPKRNLKSESSSEENDEEDQDVIKKSHKKLSYKNTSRAHKKSSKDASHVAIKKSKKVTFFKKSSRSKDDSSEDEESDKESDSEYEAHSRKRTGKGSLKTKKHIKNNKRNMNPAPPRRAKRMASLNARAMMHCMNEDARIPLPTLPVSTAKSDNMALILRDPVIHDTHSEESDEEDRDYDSDDDKRGKRRKNIKRKNEEENEKKVKIKRKRRRGELDVHMDMRDMVVTKRMASLNASAIMAASYSSESRKRNPTATTTSSSAESEITNVDIKRKISVKSTKERNTTTSSVITVEETTKKVKKAQGSRETEVEEHIIVKKKVKRQGGTDSDQEDGNATDNSELAGDILTRTSEEPKGMMEESTCTFMTTHTPTAPQTVTISGESTYCITSSDGKTTTMVKQVQRKTTTTGGSTTSAPPTACIPPTHHVQPQPQSNSYPMAAQKPDNYSPLGALSTMQPVMSPGGTPHHHHHHHHHQPHPPPHHQPPPIHPSHLPPPHHQPPHHHPPSHHPPPHPSQLSYPQSHHHHPHHQPYHPPPSSHPHPTSAPLGHHCGYRPPPQTPPSGSSGVAGSSCQGNHPPSMVGPPMVGSYPSHSSPGYVAPGHTVSPGHSITHPPHHSPKQMASPNQVSPSIKSPQGGTGGPHPSSGSQRPAPLTAGQVERHHSAFTAPAPSTHSPAASTPAGYQPVSGPMPVKPNYTATTSDGSGPYKAPKGSPVAAAPPYSSPPRLTSPPLPIKAPPSQSGSEPYSPPYQYHAYSYHPAPPPPPPPPPPAPHVAPYDKYYPRGATYHFYPPTYSGGQYPPTASSAEYSYPPPPSGGMHYSQESYTSYTLCVPNAPPQGPPQALALPPPPPTSNGPHPPAYATYHYTEYTPVFAYPPTGTIVKINLIGPSSQSTICCPVDPKNVYTWPPTRNGRGSEGSSNSNQCSGLDQGSGAGYPYSYRPTQQPPQPSSNSASQGCGAPSVYQSGPLTTVMTTGTQPTIQVFGAVVPQQTVTLIPPQESQTVNAPPPSVPPPVPAPVPPVVPLSQPQLTTATTMVAMAPISVTVPLTPGATHASQASTVPAQASTTASGISEPSVPARHHTSAYGSGTVSQLATANSCSTSTPEVSSVTALPPQPISAASSETLSCTTAIVSGIPQTAVNLSLPVTTGVTGRTHPVVSSSDRTSVLPQTTTAPSQIATVSANSQVSLPMLSPTQTTATIISSKPQSYVTPTQVTAGVVAGVPHHTATSTHGTTAIVTGVPQTGVATTNVTTAVVTGVPQPSVAPVAVSSYQILPSSECTKAPEVRPVQCAPLPARTATTHASTNYHTVTQSLPSNKAISLPPQGAGNLTDVSTTESQLQEQTAKTEAITQDSVVSGAKPHVVNTHFTTSSVSGAQKAPISSPHMPHSAVTSGQESHQTSSKIMMAVVTGVPKPMAGSTHINTAVVSGVPRVPAGTACSPTGATAILAPASMKDTARISLTDIPKKPLSTIQSSQDTQEKLNCSLSSPSDVCKNVAVLHKVSPNQSVQHFAKAATLVNDGKSLSHIKDAIDLTIAEPQTTKPRRALEALGNLYKDGMQNTCSVPPMDESGVIIRDCIPAKKRKINCSVPAQTIEPPASVSTAISTPLTPPSSSVGCLSSRNWSPTQPGITSDTVVSCASKSVNEMSATPSLDKPSAGVQGLSKVQGLSVGEVRTNLNSFTPSSISLSSLGHNQTPIFSHPKSVTCSNSTSVVCSSVTPPPTSQTGGITSVVRDVPRLNVHTDVAQNKDSEGNKSTTNNNPPQQGYQRSGPRHLLCQTLPTPTLAKAATAPLAKPKSSSTSNVPKLLVKSEEKPKDVKPNIMGNVPISQSTSLSFELSSNVISNNNNSAKEELESDFLDVKTDLAPIVRKRGRPPKTRDTSSDSSTSETSTPNSSAPLSQETKKSNSPSKTLQNTNENEVQKNKPADGNSQGGKILRSRTEEKKKENLQSSSISPSLSKQAEDSKADIKPAGAMNIKTEVLPKIKTEKVSPKGSTKMSSFKMCPKDVSHFKTKIVEGPDEIPLKSGSIPKKFDLPSPSKGGGVTETLKPTKVLRDTKKPSVGLLSDQRVPKNSLVASKSKSKEAADKKSTNSNNNVKRRSGDNIAVGGKSAASSSTKTSAAEGGGRTSIAGKNQTSKSQKAAKSTKATSRRSPPNGRLNRKKSLLSYLKEDINESDTSSVDSEVVTGGRKRSRSKEDPPKSNSSPLFCPSLPINAGSRRRSAVMHGKGKATKKPRWVHNWSWEGEPFEGKIWLRNDELELDRTCYRAMRHKEGDIVRVRDCVLLRSGPRKTDLPFVAKIASLWEDPETSDMMMSILWYYRPEHTDSGRRPDDLPDEIFASKHRDHLSVACIEDRCYVLTFNEYCRYRRLVRFFQEGVYPMATPVPDPEEGYCRKDRLPPGCVVPDLLFFCRRVYDYRIKRLLKNPY